MALFGWNDYYDKDTTFETKHENEDFNSTTLLPKEGDSYIYNCYFYDLTAENGAAILYSLSGSYLLVEKCSFYHCTSTQNTAGIRVSSGNCIIAFSCGQNCFSQENDGFCSVTSYSQREINSVFDSSISHCEAIDDNIIPPIALLTGVFSPTPTRTQLFFSEHKIHFFQNKKVARENQCDIIDTH